MLSTWKWIVVPSVLAALIAWLAQTPDDFDELLAEQQPADVTSTTPPPLARPTPKQHPKARQPLSKRERRSKSELEPEDSSSSSSSSSDAPTSVFVIGDLHGDAHCARYWVDRIGVLGKRKKKTMVENDDDAENDAEETTKEEEYWLDPSNHLVFVGDYIDKGPTSKQTLEYVKSLTDRFPTQVTALMGNHEMELLLDRDARRHAVWGGKAYYQLAYSSMHPGEYKNFLPTSMVSPEDDLVIEALYNASVEVYGYGQHRQVIHTSDETNEASILHYISDLSIRSKVQQRLKLYQQQYIEAFRSGTELGDWLEQRPVAALVDGTLFLHGGLSANGAQVVEMAERGNVGGIDALNQLLHMNSHESKLLDFIQGSTAGQIVYEMLTFRGNHQGRDACANLNEWLSVVSGAERLAVGHTPGDSVRLHCGQQFLAVDSALGRWFRNSGNDYCPGHVRQQASNRRYTCYPMNPQCEGQIVQISQGHIRVIGGD